jgi:hypothetical protein
MANRPGKKVCQNPPNKMKKLLALIIALAGFGMAAHAQTLLYEWNFTNTLTTTPTSSVPSVAVSPGTGNLFMKNGQGTTAIGVNAYFTNGPGVGPGAGAGGSGRGALTLVGQGYNGSGVAATTLATNLNIGKRIKFTVTFWFQFGTSVGTINSGGGSFPRMVMLANNLGYDSGSANTGVGVGASVNNWTAANGPDDGVNFAQQIQNGNGNNSGAIPPGNLGAHFTLPEETGTLVNGIVASDFGVINNTNWYFEAMTFDGTLASGQFKTWLGTSATNVILVDSQNAAANMLPQPDFTTNAVLFLANRNGGTRPLASGAIADVRIYSGICSSNNLEALRTFSTNFVDDGSGNANTAPAIQLSPASGPVHPGFSRSFNVVATGLTPLSYQWKTNNVNVGGATNAAFTLSSIPVAFNGMQVTCTVTNLLGSTNTTAATLSVVPTVAGSYAQGIVTNNPYIYWHINESTNGSANPGNPVTIYDYANGLDGSAVDPVNMNFNYLGLDAPSYPGFAATNQAIQILRDGNFSRLNMSSLPAYTNDMTICGWIYITNTPSAFGIIYSMNGGNNGANVGYGYGLYFGPYSGTDANGNNTLSLSYNWNLTGLNATAYYSALNVPLNEWTFVALIIDPTGSTATLYMGSHSSGFQMSVDDTNATGDIISGTGSGTAPIVLGRSPYSFYEQGQGSANGGNTIAFNDVSIFYKALSSNSIASLYIKGAGVYLSGTPDVNTPGNLLLTYPMGTLLSAPAVTGPYTPVSGAANPWSVAPTDPQRFYRVSFP